MHLDVLDLRNFYYRTQLGWVLVVVCMAVVLVLLSRSMASAEDLPMDRAAVERCFSDTLPGTLDAACVGAAAERCSKTPPLTESTLDIWQCYVAEANAWDDIAAGLAARLRVSWRAIDKANRDAGWDIDAEGMATEASFERLIIAEQNYRAAMCGMIYAANGPGSMKNIYSGRCRMEMASRWALKLRDGDWTTAASYLQPEQ